MFSVLQKQQIASAVETAILDIGHPEMPTTQPMFRLHVDGKEGWSWADIEPNWTYEKGNMPGVNPHNENVAEQMNREAGERPATTAGKNSAE